MAQKLIVYPLREVLGKARVSTYQVVDGIHEIKWIGLRGIGTTSNAL